MLVQPQQRGLGGHPIPPASPAFAQRGEVWAEWGACKQGGARREEGAQRGLPRQWRGLHKGGGGCQWGLATEMVGGGEPLCSPSDGRARTDGESEGGQ